MKRTCAWNRSIGLHIPYPYIFAIATWEEEKLPNLLDFKPTGFVVTGKRYRWVEHDQFLTEGETDSVIENYPEPEIANENLSTTDELDVKRNERYSNENIQASHIIYDVKWRWQTTSAYYVWRQIVTL